ncbi:PhzF family phenazine biosynthesis protein [Gordonia otitidis]|uniref:Phenazine biosynthesis protein n=1 Tax=Gordonia otitidis (strain DSM 44809 / CCUG 52243 / JCM 12355 / NBRC 100426 / IFM 10032) TaxID=1108044 RepID=H5TNY0_GORO1|nr:PhzF family phenazine biosynthesis protein [Gordonia otitidis]GAB35188.1 putative phenazine biosynthesis protein [Gordonia otitidis NBRC 100426]
MSSTQGSRRFAQVDVFSSKPLRGNPVAVVIDGDGVSDDEMAAFARWTNLSETTFIQSATDPAADYRLRIFTPAGELPFAGHPTLGSAHAWLAAGGAPRGSSIVQECGVGLVSVRRDGDRVAFAAPQLRRSGAVEEALVDEVLPSLGLSREHVLAAEWIDNGPPWFVLELDSAQRVLSAEPDLAALAAYDVGLLGRYPSGHPDDPNVEFEVRGIAGGAGVGEDPVTGSLNAGIAVWLRSTGRVGESYVASQGTALQRSGRVYVDDDGENIWVGGHSTTVISGTVHL